MITFRLDLDTLQAESFLVTPEMGDTFGAEVYGAAYVQGDAGFKSILPTCELTCETCAGTTC